MAVHYTAAATQKPGRKAWSVLFRHPLKNDASNKPGKKTQRGLGTEDETEARKLVDELNDLLKNEALWSLGARDEAARRYDPRIVEIFYSEVEPRAASARQLCDKLLPLPTSEEGYARVVLIGAPGAGKTTLVRQLLGTHPKTERFPSTSANRTTTFPTEVALRAGDYEAVATFMSEHEARFEIEESISSAIVEAVEGNTRQVARAFLEKSDMRFRLKYLLGNVDDGDDFDPYADDEDEEEAPDAEAGFSVSAGERAVLQQTLAGYLTRIQAIAGIGKAEVESVQGALADMNAEDRGAALDLIEEQAVGSDAFLELVSDVLDEVKSKFDGIQTGHFEKTTTGWPLAWRIRCGADDRSAFLQDIRYFAGNAYQAFGKLLTPLVSGLRVVGPFGPMWAQQDARLVLVDTEGLGHKANATADLSESVLSFLHDADVILLVDSAKNGMTNFATGKAIESVVNAGYTRKLAVVFTHMDAMKGDNLRGQEKLDHVFGGLRNVAENQLAKNVSGDAARYLLQHLESATFYVGKIEELDPKPARPELNRLLQRLVDAQPAVFEPVAFPQYSMDNLVLAIQEAARDFRQQWQGLLGLSPHPHFRPRAWQTVKALTRRYAEGWGDGFVLQPTSNLIAALSSSVSRFLESPIGWSGNPTSEQKRDTIDRIKAAVAKQLPALSTRRLREQPQPVWLGAYTLRGSGSTFERKMRVEGIYERWVPIPDARGDAMAFEFMEEVKALLTDAISDVQKAVEEATSST